MKAPAALPFYLYDFGAIRPDSFLQGDSFKLLEGVQTETVDMVFIDPPYFIKKAEWDTFENQQEYNDFMARAFWEAERILKPNGTLAFWHNDLQQVARLLCWLENWTQFVFNSWAVWVKPNFRKKLWANPGTGNTLRSWFNTGTRTTPAALSTSAAIYRLESMSLRAGKRTALWQLTGPRPLRSCAG